MTARCCAGSTYDASAGCCGDTDGGRSVHFTGCMMMTSQRNGGDDNETTTIMATVMMEAMGY